MIAFSVPVEAIGKGRPRFVRSTGHAFTPARTQAFESLVALEASRAMNGALAFRGPLRMTIRATYLHPQSWSAKKMATTIWKVTKPDADNVAKLVKDACNRIVYVDDSQVAELTVQKKYGPIASLVVEVSQLGEEDAATNSA
jgi:Holliday junction resolvase RusA-like endonuclease